MFINLIKRRRIIYINLCWLLLLPGLLFTSVSGVFSQTDQTTSWTYFEIIPGTIGAFETPHLVGDEYGIIHAFHSQDVGITETQVAVFYNQWRVETGWSLPNDIILPPFRRQAHVQGVHLDSDGIIHLIFFGGDDLEANIYYAKATAQDAFDSRAWSTPVIVGNNAITPRSAALVGNDKSKLVVIYSGNIGQNGIYALYSTDNGQSWTEPEPIFTTSDDVNKPWSIKMHTGLSGSIHAVWNLVDGQGFGIEGYFSNLNSNNMTWSEPVLLDIGIEILGIQALSVVELNGKIFVMYNNGLPPSGPPVRWFIQSLDDGLTWTDPYRPFPDHIGGNGPPAFVIDKNNVLHALFGNRTHQGSIDIHGMWHSTWETGSWSAVEALVAGPLVRDREGAGGFDPSVPNAIIHHGNILFITWMNDPGAGRSGTFSSYKFLGYPQAVMTPLPILPTEIAKGDLIENENSELLPTYTPLPVSWNQDGDIVGGYQPFNISLTLILGITPSIFLVTFFIFIVASRTNKRS